MLKLGGAGNAIAEWLANAADLTDLARGSTVWLAVTGLSRAGKTVFITSLVHNLLSAMHSAHRMPLLNVVGEGRLIGARLAAAKARVMPQFPYQRNIQRMADIPPDWPARTTDISEIEIDLTFVPKGTIGRLARTAGSGHATLRLKIVDYPGEWLLDLPLLSQTYGEWSQAMLDLWRRPARASITKDFLDFVAAHPHPTPASEELAKRAHDLYRAMLIDGRDKFGLTCLQPGRFVCPGAIGEVPYLWFAPLEMPDASTKPEPGTLAALMEERYEVYRKEQTAAFYDRHFRTYGRQIVLVDILGALLAGREAFEDTRMAIEAIMRSFRYGRGDIISRLLRGTRIERVLFAATKADHVPDMQRDHLSVLLRNMAALPALDVAGSRASIDVTTVASVVSTCDDMQEIDGHRVQVVVGKPVGSAKQSKFFVGNIPVRPPRPEAWNKPFLNIPVFEPPPIDSAPVDGIPHINLDLALEYLIGDRLQ